MKDNGNRNSLIVNGRVLAQIGQKPGQGGDDRIEERKFKRSLIQAQDYLIPQVKKLQKDVIELSENNHLENIYFRISYPGAFLAKSYHVSSIYKNADIELIGSSDWIDLDGKIGRSDFLKGELQNIELLMELIKDPMVKVQQKEIRRMDEISLLKPKLFNESTISENMYYELAFHSVDSIEELIEKFELTIGVNREKFDVRVLENNVVFIFIEMTASMVESLKMFNPLRSAYTAGKRNYSGLDSGFETVRNNYVMSLEDNEQLPWIGLIDGGVHLNNGFFRSVAQIHESSIPASANLVEHGSAVASVLLYGDLKENGNDTLLPSFRIQSIRALPSEQDMEFNLLSLDKLISEIIPNFRNIKVWNLSIGPQGPIQDEVVSSLTRLLDELAYLHDVIFVIAAGNTGNEIGFARRIQIPGDSVNNITVSSYYNSNEVHLPAIYNSIGPGREGAKLKPDLIDHGGLLPLDPIYTISSYDYLQNKVAGTSFAAPQVARKLALILNEYPDINVIEARALLEHSVALLIKNDRDIDVYGKGELDVNGNLQLLTSAKDEIRVMYTGRISAKGYVVLPIPIPENTSAKTAYLTWTIVTKTKVNPDNTDKYAEYGIEDDFYPNSEKFPFRKDGKTQFVDLSSDEGSDLAEILIDEGFRQGVYPFKESAKYLDESERRKEFLKWDTSKTQRVNKRVKSLNSPFIRLHGMSRSDSRDRIEYALIVTVRFKDDLTVYERILEEYKVLQPISIENQSQQQI